MYFSVSKKEHVFNNVSLRPKVLTWNYSCTALLQLSTNKQPVRRTNLLNELAQWLNEWKLGHVCVQHSMTTYNPSSIIKDVITSSLSLTSCLLASKPSKLTKQLICNRKSMKTAKPAKREKVLTAGMLDKAPAEEKKSQQFYLHVTHHKSMALFVTTVANPSINIFQEDHH